MEYQVIEHCSFLEHYNRCEENTLQATKKAARSIKELFSQGPKQKKQKLTSSTKKTILEVRVAEAPVEIDSDLDMSDQELDQM